MKSKDTDAVVLCYPKCSTCAKAVKWLEERGVGYTYRDIVKDRPSEKELREWIAMSDMPAGKFFNTTGTVYRALGLKDKIKSLTEKEMIRLLATDGKLVKRPLLIARGRVVNGFKEPQWEEIFAG